jgi:hypothetical protein
MMRTLKEVIEYLEQLKEISSEEAKVKINGRWISGVAG